MNWSGNFREGLAREIRENNSLYSNIRNKVEWRKKILHCLDFFNFLCVQNIYSGDGG